MIVPGQRVGYRRVSTLDQHPDRQLEGVPVDKLFTEYASGRDTQRPQLMACLQYLRAGDTLVVHSMDRLARNLDDLRGLVRDLATREVAVEFVQEHLTFSGDNSPMATLLLSLMGAFAEFERALIRERERQGPTLAKATGNYRGRPPKPGTTGTANGLLMMYAVYSGSLSAASRSAHYSLAFDV